MQNGRITRGHNFCDNLRHCVDETNRSIVGDGFGALLLWDEDNVHGIEPMEVLRKEI
jgi:hypothetical protein